MAPVLRRSKLAPPPWRVFDALVDEIAMWWVSVEGERAPIVLSSERPTSVSYLSSLIEPPDDIVKCTLESSEHGGCVLTTQVAEVVDKVTNRQASTLRHRWGEHLDRDLRRWLDEGWPVAPYKVSVYRGDALDWALLGQLGEGQLWLATSVVWALAGNGHGTNATRECMLAEGALVWVLGSKRTAVRCLSQGPDETHRPRDTDRSAALPDGAQLIIPFAEFGRRLTRVG
ncbi:MAG TPA: hypothetical protein VFN61_14940 [Acidimicrobiales bacterium]|nr:hypothetical protein [Acidimicrobiales bacterium]